MDDDIVPLLQMDWIFYVLFKSAVFKVAVSVRSKGVVEAASSLW